MVALLSAAMPGSAAADAARLLNSVEFRGPIKDVPKWSRVMNAENGDPTFVAARMVGQQQWQSLKAQWQGLPLLEQLKAVNNYFNQWPYRLDDEVYGLPDYWGTPAEFIKNSGDCEDFSIAKYYALRALGVSADKMRIVIVMNTMRNAGHAVLAVNTGDDWLILDNMSNLILSHSKAGHYKPQFSVNEQYRWMHAPIKQ
jgi:predicted transglutaminase-like cysteine proteinase